MGGGLTLEQLARYTGEPEDRLRDWRSRGVIGAPEGSALSADDIERVRLVQLLLRRGIALGAVAEATQSGLFDWFYEQYSVGRAGAAVYSLAEAADLIGFGTKTLQRFREAMGSVGPADVLDEEELALMGGWKVAAEAGVPEEAMVEMIRVYTDNLNRIAEAEQRLYRFYVQRRLEERGLALSELVTQLRLVVEQLNRLVEPLILYFHRRGIMMAIRDDLATTLAEQLGLAKRAETTADLQMAVVFIDLSSFTPLAEAMGDVAAAGILERFSSIVRNSVGAFAGRIVKQIGDAFMLVFPDPRSAVACALEIEAQAVKEPQFPAVRAGIHWGTVLYREGDYVGSNVNIASRLATEAERHQVLVTADVRREARDLPDVEFARLGKRKLKGLSGSFDLFEVRVAGAMAAERAVDPVCGMELGPAEVAARLSLEGAERAFCSDACLRKFVASPESYGA